MNLPDSAIEFLDGFRGLYRDPETRLKAFGMLEPHCDSLPLIHVHCFYKHDPDIPEPDPEEVHEDLRARVSDRLNFQIPVEELSFHKVRKVAPTKTMFCITFRLPMEVAIAEQ